MARVRDDLKCIVLSFLVPLALMSTLLARGCEPGTIVAAIQIYFSALLIVASLWGARDDLI